LAEENLTWPKTLKLPKVIETVLKNYKICEHKPETIKLLQ